MSAKDNNYLIDSHCHIDFAEFDDDRETVLERALASGVERIIVPAVAQKSWQKTIDVCNEYDRLELALGLHPVFIDQHQPQHLIELADLITKNSPCALGEIGLDFYLKELDQDKQKLFFTKQLIIAKRRQLPIIIHNRNAHDECIKVLREIGAVGGIVHAFNGSIQQAHKYMELGFLLGFGGMLTFERSRKLRELAIQIPLANIALETDAPDMTVAHYRGQRNSPEYLPFVLNTLAELKNMTPSKVAHTTSENVISVLHLEN